MQPRRAPRDRAVPSRRDAPLVAAGARAVRAVANRLGFDVVAYRPEGHVATRRRLAFRDAGISLVVDAGANAGQYARRLRAQGYHGRIVSLEPLSDAFASLAEAAARDPLWECRRLALGDHDGRARLNVAGNSESSSVLAMTPVHLAEEPKSRYVGTEEVTMARLDTIRESVVRPEDRVHLKLDVQGAERAVLAGAEATLAAAASLECELSLVPLYDGQALIEEVIAYVEARGLSLVAAEPAFATHSGRVVQLDGLFQRLG